ncbi:MAG: TIGR01777 family oxidoreductase [Bacteroidetes bacterium]|jgi:uncharacterized protein (TIGR01777 family)|nr:TIGR01777 family oxidoreductase [Bacteroidota bacterium]
MKILMTGGTGLIGSRLSARLVAAGHELFILTRGGQRGSTHGSVHFVPWDGAHLYPDAVGPVDAVINLAGAGIADHKWTPEYKKIILNSRVQATRAVAQYIQAQRPKPRVLLQASAVGYYGTDPKKVFQETDGPGRDFLARTCVAWEEAAGDAGIRTVLLRTGIVLAPEGGAFPKLLAPFKFYAGGYLGDGQQPFPWIHIADVVDLYAYALEHESVSGPINVAAPQHMTNRGFSRLLGRALHRPSGLPIPRFAIKAMLGEQAMLVLEGQYTSSEKLSSLGYAFRYAQAEAAVADIVATSQAGKAE